MLQILEQRKLCSITKSVIIWDELVAACHMDETGQTRHQLTSVTKPQLHGDAIVFLDDGINAGQQVWLEG